MPWTQPKNFEDDAHEFEKRISVEEMILHIRSVFGSNSAALFRTNGWCFNHGFVENTDTDLACKYLPLHDPGCFEN